MKIPFHKPYITDEIVVVKGEIVVDTGHSTIYGRV